MKQKDRARWRWGNKAKTDKKTSKNRFYSNFFFGSYARDRFNSKLPSVLHRERSKVFLLNKTE